MLLFVTNSVLPPRQSSYSCKRMSIPVPSGLAITPASTPFIDWDTVWTFEQLEEAVIHFIRVRKGMSDQEYIGLWDRRIKKWVIRAICVFYGYTGMYPCSTSARRKWVVILGQEYESLLRHNDSDMFDQLSQIRDSTTDYCSKGSDLLDLY